MPNHLDADIPTDFAKRIHLALRAYHARHTEDMLDDLLLAHQIRAERGIATSRFICNQILIDGLDRLKQIDGEAADLVQRRFLSEETALEVAYSRNLSEDIVFQRQRAAIAQLAQAIWNQELELRQRRTRRVEARLEPPTFIPCQFQGVADTLPV